MRTDSQPLEGRGEAKGGTGSVAKTIGANNRTIFMLMRNKKARQTPKTNSFQHQAGKASLIIREVRIVKKEKQGKKRKKWEKWGPWASTQILVEKNERGGEWAGGYGKIDKD